MKNIFRFALLCLLPFSACKKSSFPLETQEKAIKSSIAYLVNNQGFMGLIGDAYPEGDSCYLVRRKFREFHLALNPFPMEDQQKIERYRASDFGRLYDLKSTNTFMKHFSEYSLDQHSSCERSRTVVTLSTFQHNSLIAIVKDFDEEISQQELEEYRPTGYEAEYSFMFFFDEDGEIVKVYETFIAY
ncbi:MAG: hypothetical protein HRU41_23720 [Saprospiraceae bacterium]|nr:hypothetical protein [Saprospiraceae bacterium]